MPELENPFDATDWVHDTSPPDRHEWFHVKILESTFSDMPNDAKMLHFHLLCIDGKETGDLYKGRVWRCGLWWEHSNPKCVSIGRTQIANLAIAAGKPRFTNSDELNGVELMANVGPGYKPEYPEASKFAGLPRESRQSHEHYRPEGVPSGGSLSDDEIPF